MGQFWDLIQQHIDSSPYPPSERTIAKKLGLSPNTLTTWKTMRKPPSAENIRNVALLVGVPYRRMLEAALRDTGYLPEESEHRGNTAPTSRARGSRAPSEVTVEESRPAVPPTARASTRRSSRGRPGGDPS